MAALNLFFISFCATGLYVFLRAFQQINVVYGHWARILPTSIAMGIGDVILILIIVKADTVWIGVTNGLGGALGCYLAMWISKTLHERKKGKL